MTKETKLKEKEKINKGITLIALVITIIVLLILAGVSIAILTGENGILKKVKEAKLESSQSKIKEQIELAVLASRLDDELNISIDLENLEKELNKIEEITEIEKKGLNQNLPWNIKADGFIFEIAEDGTVRDINGIILSETNLKILVGESKTITATLTEGITGTISWEIEDTDIVTINSTQENSITINAQKNGMIKIIAKVDIGGKQYETTCKISVVSNVTSISVEDIDVDHGGSKTLQVETIPDKTEIEDLTYISSDETIAIVDENGKVTGIGIGTTTITVAGKISTDVKDTCTVTVQKSEIEANDIANSPTSFYGSIVTGYSIDEGEYTWKIYHADSENIYLIADSGIAYTSLPLSENGNKATSVSTNRYYFQFGKILNDLAYSDGSDWILNNSKAKKWLSKYLDQYPNSSNNNMKATAYMLDTNVWSGFANDSFAEYAIASPTLELFCESYTATHPDNYPVCDIVDSNRLCTRNKQ